MTISNCSQSSKLNKMIDDEIDTMLFEVESSHKGEQRFVENPKDYRDFICVVNNSTFPSYYRESKAKDKEAFRRAVTKKKGPVYERLKVEAKNRLMYGYKNAHGYDEPNEEFLKLVKDSLVLQ